jgi:hypothetical protein
MTDTRLPSRWLLDPAMEQLTDRAWRTFTGSLMWSNEAGTDGFMPRRSLRFFHPEGVDSATLAEIMAAGLWVQEGNDLRVPDWEKNGQELREVVDGRRAGARERKRAERDRKKKAAAESVTRDVTRVEEDRQGKDRQGQDEVLQAPRMRIVEPETAPVVSPPPAQMGGFFPPGSNPFGPAA